MVHIVKKKVHGNDYYYLIKSIREGDKVKSKTIAYLGKTRKEADEKAEGIIKELDKREEERDKKGSAEQLTKEKALTKEEHLTTKQLPNEGSVLTIDEVATFCKRRGFVYADSEIYGGIAGFWDFGPLGVELYNNIKQHWWKFFVKDRENMVGIDASIISHPRTWKASGHIANFSDISIECKKCKKINKIDKADIGKVKCEFCKGELDEKTAKELNLLFSTQVGPENGMKAYLRGETAQGMFLDFKLVTETSRVKLPFGIAQVGKCFRNEIAPRDFLFRSREFTIGEFEFFINPYEKKCKLLERNHLNTELNLLDAETQEKNMEELRKTSILTMLDEKRLEEWHAYWLAEQLSWYKELGINMDKLKVREHKKSELSHYSSATFDIDYEYPFGSKEVAGIANRGQFDLTQHIKESGEKLEFYDEESKKKVIPCVIEPTFGMERAFLAVLVDAYNYDKERENVVLRLKPELAPFKAAVFPLVNKLNDEAKEIFNSIKKDFATFYDTSGSIGRRYARQDEIGTPLCITIDFDSAKNKDVTIRDRDTTKQIRVKVKDLKETIKKLLNQEIKLEKAGKLIK
jgi:glycyl-tRNA synthetase